MQGLRDFLTTGNRPGPGRTAIIEPGRGNVSYGELQAAVAGMAADLQREGIAGGHTVAIALPKDTSCVVSLCAVLSAGAAYVPVDLHSPLPRITTILQDCRVTAIITRAEDAGAISAGLPCRCILRNCGPDGLVLVCCLWEGERGAAYAQDLAVILYTSGSTGCPKGVQLTQANVLTFVDWCLRTFEPGERDVYASIAPFNFDLSLFDLFTSLHSGATLVLLDQKTCQNPLLTAACLAEHRVSVIYATPTLLKMLLHHGRLDRHDHSALSLVLFAGEPFDITALRQLTTTWTRARFYNLYGPTESNVVTFQPVRLPLDPERSEPLPIGRACDHARIRLLTEAGAADPVPFGTGELMVCGPSVSPGYYGDPERNRRVFHIDTDGDCYYRTGDLVSVDAEGALVFIGRLDRTIKRRGYRIALEEIDRVMGLHPGIRAIATVAHGDGADMLIETFVVGREGAAPSRTALREHCLNHLPAYFLPDRFTGTTELPMTTNGKIDYRRLASGR